MPQPEQINLAEKSVNELKALAFDFQEIVNHHSEMLRVVRQELANRINSEKPNPLPPAPDNSKDKKGRVNEKAPQ